MSNPTNNLTNITPPRVPLTDSRTGLISREWYRFFLSLFQLTGSGQNTTSLTDLQVGPPTLQTEDITRIIEHLNLDTAPSQEALVSQIAELQKQVQGLALLPTRPLGTMSQLEQALFPWMTFNTAPQGVPPTVGTLAWDGGTTLGVQMTTNVLGRVNESGYYYIKASSAITQGQVVMFTGAVGASGVPTGAPATGVTDGSYIMGIAAESIANNAFGLVQFIGTLRGVNLSAFADGDILWYNPAVTGGLTKTKPSAPNVKVQMAAVISASNNGTMLIRVSAGSVLGGTDSNVQFGTLANKDLIQYDSALGYWKNVAASSIAIGTATNLAGGLAGSLPYQTAADTTSMLAIGTAGQVLKVNAGGTAPQWTSGSALTKTDDTNVTLTLGGSPSSALLAATSLTLGWTGTLAVARGGIGTGTAGIGAFNNITGYTATGATGTTSTNLVFSTNPTITNLVVNGYEYIENGTTYNTSANAIQEIGASNDTSVDNNATYRWRWIVEGNATNQNLVLYAYRRGTTTIERARYTSSGFSLPTGQTYQINNTTVLSGSALGSGITGSSLTSVGTLTTGVWNATPITNTYLANSSITINGSSVSLGGSVTVSASTTNALTFNNGGAGVASGSTFNGGSAVTVSYNTIGASPLAGSTSLITLGTVTTGTWNATAIAAAYGGTGQTTYAVGDLLYASSTSALSRLADIATGNALISGGVGVAPAWGKVGLTTHVSGTLPVGNGGTGVTTFGGTNRLLYTSSTDTLSSIATANTSALVTNSSGVPAWVAGTTANRVLRTDGTTVSFGQVALATDVSGTLPVANSLLYYNTNTKTMNSGGNYDWYSIDFGNYAGRSARVEVVFSLVSGGGGSRVWYRNSIVVETGGASLSENNITAINGANGSLSFVLSGATLTVRTTTSASGETARMSIMVQGYEMTSSRISVL